MEGGKWRGYKGQDGDPRGSIITEAGPSYLLTSPHIWPSSLPAPP